MFYSLARSLVVKRFGRKVDSTAAAAPLELHHLDDAAIDAIALQRGHTVAIPFGTNHAEVTFRKVGIAACSDG